MLLVSRPCFSPYDKSTKLFFRKFDTLKLRVHIFPLRLIYFEIWVKSQNKSSSELPSPRAQTPPPPHLTFSILHCGSCWTILPILNSPGFVWPALSNLTGLFVSAHSREGTTIATLSNLGGFGNAGSIRLKPFIETRLNDWKQPFREDAIYHTFVRAAQKILLPKRIILYW